MFQCDYYSVFSLQFLQFPLLYVTLPNLILSSHLRNKYTFRYLNDTGQDNYLVGFHRKKKIQEYVINSEKRNIKKGNVEGMSDNTLTNRKKTLAGVDIHMSQKIRESYLNYGKVLYFSGFCIIYTN